MDRNIRYQRLHNEEGDTAEVDTVQVEIAIGLPPPGYEEAAAPPSASCHSGADHVPVCPRAPPSYQVATELPSYDEAERTKQEEAASAPPTVHDTEAAPQARDTARGNSPGLALGTDCIFLCTFAISFLFNWVGFFISLCLSNTVAGRCGALAGLGLSIVKWAAILQHSEWMSDYVSDSDHWIWWFLMFCGFVVFFRGCIQYFQIKYEWKKVTGQVLTLRWFN